MSAPEKINLSAFEAELRAMFAAMEAEAEAGGDPFQQLQGRTSQARIALALWGADEQNRGTEGQDVLCAVASILVNVVRDIVGPASTPPALAYVYEIAATMVEQERAGSIGVERRFSVPTQKVS